MPRFLETLIANAILFVARHLPLIIAACIIALLVLIPVAWVVLLVLLYQAFGAGAVLLCLVCVILFNLSTGGTERW